MNTAYYSLWLQSSQLRTAIILTSAVLFSVLCALALIATAGVPITTALTAFAEGAWGSPYVIGASINRSLVFALVGMGFILADRANLTNVGAEGQIAVGGIVATAVSLYSGCAHLPDGLSYGIPMLAATLAGALWGSIAGVLKAKVGTNEVISTLLLSFIAVWVLYGCVQSEALLKQPMTDGAALPESLPIPDSTQIPNIFISSGFGLHLGLIITIILALILLVTMKYSRFGLRLSAVGLNPQAAKRAGMQVASTIIIALAISGAFGGLAGALMLQGDQQSLKAGFSSGYGFDGMVVGLLARGSISGVFIAALLFGFLRSGGINMEMVAQVPSAIVLVVQGVIILTLAGTSIWLSGSGAKK
ncbi:ABC transporter permease [Aquirhabdus parva]|uniref:ABC transporter permease n=1 Tax=Aquirhabdus parva TaxID=2283318 RepID=A0A345P3Q7_9GAMM|nr:ABC transporter permease [Aquirhabdus parva]AXI01916.1 ABC transporter permease [Aquirhabdus parva]